jgi:hypothetical protein
LYDTEELVALPWWLRRNVPVLRERFPAVPETVWHRLTGGRSAFCQAALNCFGPHGLVLVLR